MTRAGQFGYLDTLYARELPNCVRANFSLVNRELRFETTAPVTNLPTVINGLAHEGRDIPYWIELVEREHRSSSYSKDLYSLVAVSKLIDATNAVPSGLVWHDVFHSTPVNLTIRYAVNKTGTLRFNPSTGFCKCHNRFAMRIYGEGNQWIWENMDDTYARCKVALRDSDNDGVDEIMIIRDNHNSEHHLLRWEPKPQQGGGEERR